MTQVFYLDLPANFHFRRTVLSHGWYSLLPFELDRERWRLTRVFAGRELTAPVSATVSEENGRLKINVEAETISPTEKKKIVNDVRHIFRLDDDLSDFYALVGANPEFAWIAETSAGRILRSPTVFEDLVKTICTTNCSWALTEKMVTNLVENLGETAADGKRAFPTPEAMAEKDADFYKNEIRVGYRAPYFAELARAVASGKLDPEAWLTSRLPAADLKKQIKRIKGVGDYAAENLFKLIGRYDGLALDSWLRAQFYKKRNGANVCKDSHIKQFYEHFGQWRGLAMWCDMTENWL